MKIKEGIFQVKKLVFFGIANLFKFSVVDDVIKLCHLFVNQLHKVGLVGAGVGLIDGLHVPGSFILNTIKWSLL